MIVVVVPIAMAPCPNVFQITPLVFCLAAVFSVLALGVMQLGFGFTDLLFAPFVIVTIYGPRGDRSAQE